jgi:hypothetical protein
MMFVQVYRTRLIAVLCLAAVQRIFAMQTDNRQRLQMRRERLSDATAGLAINVAGSAAEKRYPLEASQRFVGTVAAALPTVPPAVVSMNLTFPSGPTAFSATTADATESMPRAKVLYVVKSFSKYYDTRLSTLMKTWGSLVDRSLLLLVGDQDSPDLPVYKPSECMDSCGMCLSCRVAHALVLASLQPGNWSWVFLVDDDHYIRTAEVERELANLDATQKLAVGCWGCGNGKSCNGVGGFCGGVIKFPLLSQHSSPPSAFAMKHGPAAGPHASSRSYA